MKQLKLMLKKDQSKPFLFSLYISRSRKKPTRKVSLYDNLGQLKAISLLFGQQMFSNGQLVFVCCRTSNQLAVVNDRLSPVSNCISKTRTRITGQSKPHPNFVTSITGFQLQVHCKVINKIKVSFTLQILNLFQRVAFNKDFTSVFPFSIIL